MKKDQKVKISDVYDILCKRDPAWYHMRLTFKTLYDGWRQVELRKRIRSHVFYSDAWQRGWLPLADFERFKRYALQ